MPEKKRRIVSDVDRLIKKYGFDLESFQKEKDLWVSKVKQVTKEKDCSVAEKIGLESEEHCQRVQQMIRPIYEEMLKLGYSEIDLIG